MIIVARVFLSFLAKAEVVLLESIVHDVLVSQHSEVLRVLEGRVESKEYVECLDP